MRSKCALNGQMVSVYALGSTLFAVPLVAFIRGWSRKLVIILALSGLLVFNSLTAFSNHFYTSLVYRFIAGMAAGLVWGIFAGFAHGLVVVKDQDKAVAIAAIGQPIALALGLPLATFLASHFDWRLIFGFISILTVMVICAILFGVKNVTGNKEVANKSIFRVLAINGIITILRVMFLWILSHNVLYIYMSSYLTFIGGRFTRELHRRFIKNQIDKSLRKLK